MVARSTRGKETDAANGLKRPLKQANFRHTASDKSVPQVKGHASAFYSKATHRQWFNNAHFKETLTVWDCRFWLASITAVRGTVSSSSSLPGDGFSSKDMPAELTGESLVRTSVRHCLKTLRWVPAERRKDVNKLRDASGDASFSFAVTRKRCSVIGLLRRPNWRLENHVMLRHCHLVVWRSGRRVLTACRPIIKDSERYKK